MKSNIEKIRENIAIAEAFIAKYGDKLDDKHSVETGDYVFLTALSFHAATFGKVFGTHGWTRELSGYNKFDWKKTVDGVRIIIFGAEEMTFNNSPVDPKQFPLELTETSFAK